MRIKKELRYIRYRICRSIYYADQCPHDYKKNYKEIMKNAVISTVFGTFGIFTLIFLALFM